MVIKFIRSFYTYCIIILISASSCSHRVIIKSDELVIFPSPPDTARIQYLTSFSNSENIAGKRSGFASFILGDAPVQSIGKPFGVAVQKEKIYICDPFIKGLEIIDFGKQTYTNFTPSGKGELQLPLNCKVDTGGNIYVADGKRCQIVVFDKYGHFVNAFGEPDNFKPTDIFITDKLIFVTNLKNNKINVYDKADNRLKFSFPDIEPGNDGFLYSPTTISVADGKVYVNDFGDFKIKIYDENGKYLSSVGSYGKAFGQLARPKGIAVDRESNLFVVDAGFENVQIFNRDGKLLTYFGGPYKGPGYMWLPAGIAVDYSNLAFFSDFVDPDYDLNYLIFVVNQYGPDKISVYGAVSPSKATPEEKIIRLNKSKDRKIKRKGKSLL